jgi:hypothetical protein
MQDRPIETMSEAEFEAFLDQISTSEFDDLMLPSLLDTLWALPTARVGATGVGWLQGAVAIQQCGRTPIRPYPAGSLTRLGSLPGSP